MQIKQPKSHSPIVHDNTDEHLIMVPPSVLENKLEKFEIHARAWGVIGSDVALMLTFIIAIVTSQFRDFSWIKGATIEGAFYIGAIVMAIKVGRGLYRIYNSRKVSRADIVKSMLVEKDQESKRL